MGKFINEVGNGYNRLVVLERVENDKQGSAQFLCQCSCGQRTVVRGVCLRNGNTQSCGCLLRDKARERNPAIDVTGQIFGRLTVIERVENDGRGNARWLCQCSCGQKTVVMGVSLRSGDTQSCGCLARELSRERCIARILPDGGGAFVKLFCQYRAGAKRRGLAFELTKEQFRGLVGQNCFYCGCPPSNTQRGNGSAADYIYSGLDRVDPRLGYSVTNCVASCRSCNSAKGNRSVWWYLVKLKKAALKRVMRYAVRDGGREEKTRSVLPFTRELPIEGQVVTGGLAE